ncbi:uncharacterized protein LOC128549861 [Mercenaria mercenaria]|uniref:uncharacterized protein LOC128549861 n=1 Tax=Mercenaria mercenaria TaxID=6596 RepID=UPI00234F2FB9|nr:uncharacterized protein LOC128549861 [Mercenaria mercenaria]
MVPPNQLAMTDQNNKLLKLVNISDGKMTGRAKFCTPPKFPTLLPQDRLAVLLLQESIIKVFSIHDGFKEENVIRLNGKCVSIMFENDVFFAVFRSPAVVKKVNMKGEELKTIALESHIQDVDNNPIYTALCPDKSSFYLCDWKNNLPLRVDMKGHTLAMYEKNGLNDPHGILAMSDGSVYVCNKNNHTVLQMRGDFTRSRVVLGPSDNVQFPAAICYRPERNILFVSSASADSNHSFKLKMFSLENC